MNKPTLHLNPRHPALLAGFDNQLDVLVSLEAPVEQMVDRTPLNLAIVLDRSGSMSGQPLSEAKRCASFIIDRLGPNDRAALVTYDSGVELLVPSTTVTDKERFHVAIRSIDSRGMTALHDGWLMGAGQVSPHIATNSFTRVILLSDGQANVGLTDIDEIANQCGELADAGVSTSTYGLGQHFNEELMLAMSKAGRGNAYYGVTAEDLMDPFQEEFDLLSSLCAKNVRLTLSTPPELNAAVLNEYTQDAIGRYVLPDLAAGGEAWAVVRVRIPAAYSGKGEGDVKAHVVAASVEYRDLDGVEHNPAKVTLELPSLISSAWQAVAEDERVASRANELEAASIQVQAQRASRRGDWREVNQLLKRARKNARDNDWLTGVADKLQVIANQRDEDRFSKEALYSGRRMHSRLAMAPNYSASIDLDAESSELPSYLRRKMEQGRADRKKRQE